MGFGWSQAHLPSYSWGADGVRQRRWHNGRGQQWNTVWAEGDVIGVAADLTNGELLFARNGEWGSVFSGVRPAGGIYPAFTIRGTNYTANFGAAPFRFPPPDGAYAPVAPLMTHDNTQRLRGRPDWDAYGAGLTIQERGEGWGIQLSFCFARPRFDRARYMYSCRESA